MKFSYVGCLLVMSAVLASCRGDDDESLEDAMRTLRGQVSALLERRQEDYKLLEESLKNELEKNSQLSSLRDEVETLRREVSLLRGNQQKNDHLTLQWLSSSVTELRAELTELAVAQNTSAELQRRQETESELHLLRGDSAALRRETEELRADVQKGAARAEQAAGDAAAARERSQAAQMSCADLSQQLQEARTEWAVTLKALRKTRSSAKVQDSEETNNELSAMLAATPSAPGEERKYRHQRLLQKQVQEVHNSAKKLTSSQARLQHQVHRLEKQVKTLLHSNSAGPDDGAATRELRERVSNLESSSRLSARSLFNMSRQLVALDKLHLSLLQLLESVESLENKVDRGLPDLQREISKMEFGRAQITSTSALLKEEVENQRASVKALSVGVSALQEKTDKDHSRLTEVQEQLSNLSSSLQDHEVQAAPVAQVVALVSSNDTLTSLVQDLSRVQSEYRDIVNRLPADCASTGGGRGLSLIAPGPGGPLVAWCAEEGWTVVQRRVDGSQEFNRNWSDYQTGFGSPAGEFWLGNEPLHRLTSDNCSQLRVDLQDIYGKRWRAEYSEFSVSGDHDGYRLHVAGYRGNASDALDYQNRMQFSAIDSDRDISNTHCAANYEGGWWFSHCQHANLNGRYNLGLTWFDAAKNEWIAVAWSEMKVRRREGCEGRT